MNEEISLWILGSNPWTLSIFKCNHFNLHKIWKWLVQELSFHYKYFSKSHSRKLEVRNICMYADIHN
jgi:hypothetical protein